METICLKQGETEGGTEEESGEGRDGEMEGENMILAMTITEMIVSHRP